MILPVFFAAALVFGTLRIRKETLIPPATIDFVTVEGSVTGLTPGEDYFLVPASAGTASEVEGDTRRWRRLCGGFDNRPTEPSRP